jgi:hypothetical protein
MPLNLSGSDKTFRRYVAVEGANHPPIPQDFVHQPPDGDAIGPDSTNAFTAVAATDLLTTTAHGLVAGVRLQFTTTGTLPAGLSLAADYYVIASGLTADAFQVSSIEGGSTVDITSTGTGIHSWARSLTADERAALALYLAHPLHITNTLPQLILWVAAYNAYQVNPKHLAWKIDNDLERHWQWLYRSADHADAAQGATPPSGDSGGVGGGGAHSPVPLTLA